MLLVKIKAMHVAARITHKREKERKRENTPTPYAHHAHTCTHMFDH